MHGFKEELKNGWLLQIPLYLAEALDYMVDLNRIIFPATCPKRSFILGLKLKMNLFFYSM